MYWRKVESKTTTQVSRSDSDCFSIIITYCDMFYYVSIQGVKVHYPLLFFSHICAYCICKHLSSVAQIELGHDQPCNSSRKWKAVVFNELKTCLQSNIDVSHLCTK
jgi:hypothetical protein